MKLIRLNISLLLFFLLVQNFSCQNIGVINSDGTTNNIIEISNKIDISEDIEKIKHKMYLTNDFEASTVDNIDQIFYLKFNMYNNEMEFIKADKVYNLKKINGRKVFFKNLNKTYQIFNENGSLVYFKNFNNNGKAKLLSKQVVKYVKGKTAASSYQKDKPADFKKQDDKYFIAIENSIIKLPSKKKSFFEVFENKSSMIKAFVKSNKINIKKEKDLNKVINYYNTL